MGDAMDRAQLYELEERERHIRKARQENIGPSRFTCEECDAPIPEARRAALAGVALCVSCQQRLEQKQRHFRRHE
ncbi:TraR/DksA family transcriptional regulator [Enterobacteriaceae bacterium 89]|nr:TraR/DksA family transcriptional regulator [Enterobacteriaceae bacterium 89]